MTKILVIRHRFIGDTILTIPFLRNLRRAYPDAQIDVLVGPDSGELLVECPYINNLITFDKKKMGFWGYVKLLKDKRYHKAYILKRSLSTAFLAFFAGIKERIGFDTEGRGFLLTKKVPYNKARHEIECFLDILKADNIPVLDDYLEEWIPESSNSKIDQLFKDYDIKNNIKFLVHATSGNAKKEWPPEYFARVIEYLANKKQVQIFYTGLKKDYQKYEEIQGFIQQDLNIKPVNLCGQLSIQDSLALVSKMDFVVGVDSGILHMAAALNIPVIGIYGPMNPIKWKAWGDIHTIIYSDIPCVPCDIREECPKSGECLTTIRPETVIEKCSQMLEKL